MNTFELDMAFEPAEIAAGLERLFGHLGLTWSSTRQADSRYEFQLTLPAGDQAQVLVCPLPAERMTYVGFFPRSLVQAHAAAGTDLDALRRAIILAFLRVTG